jgi:hypothetical protein
VVGGCTGKVVAASLDSCWVAITHRYERDARK